MSSFVHCLVENHIIFLFYYLSLTQLILDFSEEDDSDKLGNLFIIMDYLINRIVLCLQIVEYYIFNHIGQPSKDSDLL